MKFALLLLAGAYSLCGSSLYAIQLPGVGRVAPELGRIVVAVLSVRATARVAPALAAVVLGALLDAASIDPLFTRTFGLLATALAGTACGLAGLSENRLLRPLFLVIALTAGLGTQCGWLALTDYGQLLPTPRGALLAVIYEGLLALVVSGLLAASARGKTRPLASHRFEDGGATWYVGA